MTSLLVQSPSDLILWMPANNNGGILGKSPRVVQRNDKLKR
jgi:hypothetical protein